MDAIGQVLTESLHLRDGHFLEGSWDEYYYPASGTRHHSWR